jgi:hypothetical protein
MPHLSHLLGPALDVPIEPLGVGQVTVQVTLRLSQRLKRS